MLLNLGSGQKYLEGYINCDISADHDHKVDVICDITEELPFEDNSADIIIAEHVLEHVHLFKQEKALSQWYRVLKPGGRLVVAVPDLRALAKAYLDGQIVFFTYAVNKLGPYNGNDSDYHKWGFDEQELETRLMVMPWQEIKSYQGDLEVTTDWWILIREAIK